MMTNDEIGAKYARMAALFITKGVVKDLREAGIWKELILALTDEDCDFMTQGSVFFYGFYSPANVHTLTQDLPKGTKFLIFEMHALLNKSPRHAVATLLHELGHIMHPDEGEFPADAFAKKRGFGKDLIADLEELIRVDPKVYDKPMTHDRITRLASERNGEQ